LLLTAWLVSGTAAGAGTSVWPAVFIAFGLVWCGLAPLLINLDPVPLGPKAFLVQEGALHLAPLAIVLWFSARWLEGSAYAHLASWCWWALGAFAALASLGLAYKLWREPTSP
jgi:hypothetical protein